MANTPNMNLITPGVVGSASPTPGPTWATDLNTDLSTIDTHDHSSGNGVTVKPAGIDVNAALPMNNYPLTQIGWLVLPVVEDTIPGSESGPAGAPSVVPEARLAVFTDGTDLWYQDGNGNFIQITKNGSLANTVVGTTLVNVTIASMNMGQTDLTHTNPATAFTYTLLSTDYMLVCSLVASSATITLIASATAGKKRIEIKDLIGNAGVCPIVIDAAGSDTIDGQSSVTLASPYQAIVLTSDGNGHWMIT